MRLKLNSKALPPFLRVRALILSNDLTRWEKNRWNVGSRREECTWPPPYHLRQVHYANPPQHLHHHHANQHAKVSLWLLNTPCSLYLSFPTMAFFPSSPQYTHAAYEDHDFPFGLVQYTFASTSCACTHGDDLAICFAKQL